MSDKLNAIIEELRKGKNRAAFKKLFDEGDSEGYASTAEAERALCRMLASKTEDAGMIDELFCQSALCRPKAWEKDGYGNEIIAQVLGAMQSEANEPCFIGSKMQRKTNDKCVVTTDLAQWVREKVPYCMVVDEHTNAALNLAYTNGVYQEFNDLKFKGMIKFEIERYHPELVNSRIINEVYNLLITDLNFVPLDSFDTDENIINFRNGILRLSTMELKPHSPEYRTTIQLPCDWIGEETPTPVFDAYMERLTSGDKDVAKFLLQFIGYCISNARGERLKKSLFLVGAGNTGKSQLKALVERLLGKSNYFAIDLAGLEKRFGTSYAYGKRLVGSSDMSFLSIKELAVFKQLTGGDNIMAERKNQQGFSFKYHGLLWFCCNEMPRFSGDQGSWVYDRMCIVKCDNVIPAEERDPELLDKMYAEASGIIYKAVNAFRHVVANGYKLDEPQAVIDARDEYRHANDIVATFAEECLVPSTGINKTECDTITAVHKAFASWCRSNNNGYAINITEFKQRLASYFGVSVYSLMDRTGKGNIIKGYTLSKEAAIYYL